MKGYIKNIRLFHASGKIVLIAAIGILGISGFYKEVYAQEETPSPVTAKCDHPMDLIPSANQCVISVRALKGSEHSHDRSNPENQIHQGLLDVKEQLEDLPFAHFVLLDSKEALSPIDQELKLSLKGATGELHQVSITPHGKSEDKVNFTVNWVGPSGDTMVHSKMAVPSDSCAILGTEHEGEVCTVLCLRIACP